METIVYDLPERAEEEYAEERETGADEITALTAACRVAVAEKLRKIVAELDELEASNAAPSTNGYLLAEADALDPDGAR